MTTSNENRCGALDDKGRNACTQPKDHVGMHSCGGFMWKKKPKERYGDPRPAPEQCQDRAGGRGMKCARDAGHEGLHKNGRATWKGKASARATTATEPAAQPEVVPAPKTGVEPLAPRERIGDHDIHPAAALFPLIGGDEYTAFVDNLRANGQRHKIVRILEGDAWLILDGRNRLRACLDLGIEPMFRTFGDDPSDGDDPIAFVIAENVARRHLNETQRAFIGAELVPMYEAQAKERMLSGKKDPTLNSGQGRAATSAELAARAVNVGKASIEAALKVNREGDPEVIAASKERGQLKVSAAAELATLPKKKQREIIAKVGGGEIRSGKVRAHVKQEKKREVVRTINEQKVPPAPIGPFRVIVADFPWPYDNSDQHEGSRGHIPYPAMSIEQGLAMAGELDKLAHEDGCILAFWTTNAFMPEAVRMVEAWGFSWRTIFTWDKERDGIGTWGRGRTEHLIIAERGEVTHTLNEVSTLLRAPRREHSRKPDEAMALLEQHCPGPRLEMFSREPRTNWAAWGAEVQKFATEAA